ncbi:MAG: cation transporter [Clostridia bacterium]|nr:cation transporter [Clostridia bacterium]
MKQSFRITGIDCANCAAKLERKLQKIDGVTSLSLNFFTSKLILEAEEDRFDAVLAEVARVTHKEQPDAELGKA